MNETEAVEGEVVEAEFGRQLIPSDAEGVGVPALRDEQDIDAFVQSALNEWKAYQRLTKQLLDDSDYQKIGNNRFKKKSAWRKYAKAFGVSCQKISEEIERDDADGYPLMARVVVRASTPDGRFQEADQECHITERCCPTRTGGKCPKAAWDRHYCCPRDCDGKTHFSHPGDLPATAFTRAKNRAISDLIGAGEVSFEEADTGEQPTSKAAPKAAPTARAKAAPKPRPQNQRPKPPEPAEVREGPDDGEPATGAQASMLASLLLGSFGSRDETADFLRNNIPGALENEKDWSKESLQKALTKARASEIIDGLKALAQEPA